MDEQRLWTRCVCGRTRGRRVLMGDPPRVLAVVPGYEEGPRIGAVVSATRAHLAVLVVDDGSTDDTAANAEAAGAEVLRQVPNQGKGAALRAGFRRALEDGYDAVLALDADGQHAPDEIPRFLAAFAAPGASGPRPELIIGRRDFARMPPVRRMSNTIGTAAFSWAVGRHVPDNQSGYRLIGRRLMTEMLASEEPGFEFEVEMIAVCLRSGWTLEWVPISTIYDGAPSHVKPLAHLRHFVRATRAARRIMREGGSGANQ
ncbi:MAG: glycosyltransferase family 2 protein [Candidatus Limnocylindrales bacterium]